jgi:hypothetical protein
MSVYKNGVNIQDRDISSFSGQNIGSPAIQYIGRFDTNNMFSGSMDEMMIFNRSLSSSEILALYNSIANKYYGNISVSEGTNIITAYASDSAGNVAVNSTSINVDFTKPVINVLVPENSTLTNTQNVLVNASVSEANNQTFGFVDDGLVSWWRMDDLNSTNGLVDYMGRNNGTLVGNTAQIENGKFGKGMSFDGAGDYVGAGNGRGLNLTNQATWSFWARDLGSVDNAGIINKYLASTGKRAYTILRRNTGGIDIILSADGNTAVNTGGVCGFFDSNWTLITIVYNSTHLLYYRNGVYCDIDSTTISSINPTTEPLILGRDYTTRYFNGSLDEVMIFNRSLSADEIKALYNSSANRIQTRLNNLNEGNNNYKIYASDSAGNVANYSLSVELETFRPAVEILSPSNNSVLMEDFTNVVINSSDSNSGNKNVSTFVNTGLVSWWRMDDLNSTNGLVDYMGRNNGTLVGNTAQIANGKFGKAMNFDGDGDYVTVAYSQDLNMTGKNITVSAWINIVSTTGSTQTILTKYGTYYNCWWILQEY